jgi:hypothetical protein
MIYISHRRNTIDDLKNTPIKYGVEVDIRSRGGELIVQHDPYADGELFENWIKDFQHGTLILNVKEEGLESRLIDLMRLYKIEDYFFLDQSFPFLIKWANMGEHRCAVRVSEYESIETALALAGKIDWIWVDCFTHFPLSKNDWDRLYAAGFKLCLVSPELHGRSGVEEIPKLAQLLSSRGIMPNAVCTKMPELWGQYIDCV